MNELSKKELFLFEEYKSAVELTFHMDSLRNKLTNFFISFAGIAIAGFILALKGNDNDIVISNLNEFISVIMILVAVIGHIFICVLARIRKVQLEHFIIINNIRKYFFKNDFELWNIVQLSEKTLPKARFFSGTYYWQFVIQIVNAFILFIGILLFCNSLRDLLSKTGITIFILSFLGSLIFQNLIYFKLAKVNLPKSYSSNFKPFEENS